MADEFDSSAAARRHDDMMRQAQGIRDMLSRELIDYYYNSYPTSEDQERQQISGMRRYLQNARDRIGDLLDRLN